MKKKQEEQVRQMRELQDRVEHLQSENDRLRAQVEKRHDLGKKYVQDNSQARHLTPRNNGKEPIVPNNVDTRADDELSSGRSLDLSLAKSSRAGSSPRRSQRPAFSNIDSGTFRRARREIGRGQIQPNGVPGNAFALPTGVMPPAYPAFDTKPALYILPIAVIRSPDNMLSSFLGQHILNYKPPRVRHANLCYVRWFSDPYDHMLHYNQAMTLNVGNDHLLSKVFPPSLQGLALAWFHKLLRDSINSFNEI